MYNVLIVDDEPIIVDSYHEVLTDHMGDNLNIVKCYSAAQALDNIRNRVDILITDINMPEINGYMLQKAICSAYPKCKVIFLTGNQTLDFAQKAIRNSQFTDYILKTEDDSVFLEAVRSAIRFIESDIKADDIERNTRRNIQMALPLLRKELFEGFTENESIDTRRLDGKFNQFGLPFTSDSPVILLMGAIGEPSPINAKSRSHFSTIFFAVDHIMKEYTSHKYVDFGFTTRHNTFLWIMQPIAAGSGAMKPEIPFADEITYLHSLLDLVQDQCEKHVGIQISFIMSKFACPWEHIGNMYNQFNIVYMHQIGRQYAIWFLEDYLAYNAIPELPPAPPADGFRSYESQIEHILLTKDADRFAQVIDKLVLPYADQSQGLVELHFNICALMMRIYNAMNLPGNDMGQLVQHLMGKPVKELKKAQMTEFFSKAIGIASGVISRGKSSDNVVQYAQEYVAAHLQDDLSLAKMALLLHHSPTYFSKLFKKTTGIGYCEHVVGQRMKRAAELLETSSVYVNDLSLLVGYDSVPYFIKTFKRLLGRTPHEYREQMRKGAEVHRAF
jgi:two-component system, response regulator YesN